MDINMPLINGFETTKLIRLKGIDIPIVALTAFNKAEITEEALSAGINDIIIKPFDSFKLFEIIKILTSKSKKYTINKIKLYQTRIKFKNKKTPFVIKTKGVFYVSMYTRSIPTFLFCLETSIFLICVLLRFGLNFCCEPAGSSGLPE
jgi:CheY-like chemotaxis protein